MNQEKIMIETSHVSTFCSFKKAMYVCTKRTFDVLVSLVGMICLAPLAILIKIMYLLTGDFNSIFYKQERIGKNGKLFMLYKFRTMKPNADEILAKLLEENEELRLEYEENKKMKNDPRITKAGSIIRKLSIDEFPQFINIFKGEMSLVGNRPYLPREKKDMGSFYKEIVKTKPGLTGHWQTSGRSNTSFLRRLKLESFYSKNRSLRFDVKIILKTVVQVFRRDGAL